MKTRAFAEIIHRMLTDHPSILALLSRGGTVVLERPRYGGGTTLWYYCQSPSQLADIERALSPGSVVSFYFDDRIRHASYSPELRSTLEGIIISTGDVVLGHLQEDGLHLEVEFVDNPLELEESLASLGIGARLFYGPFPARDDDGVHAVTVVLPDEDGIVRQHPH